MNRRFSSFAFCLAISTALVASFGTSSRAEDSAEKTELLSKLDAKKKEVAASLAGATPEKGVELKKQLEVLDWYNKKFPMDSYSAVERRFARAKGILAFAEQNKKKDFSKEIGQLEAAVESVEESLGDLEGDEPRVKTLRAEMTAKKDSLLAMIFARRAAMGSANIIALENAELAVLGGVMPALKDRYAKKFSLGTGAPDTSLGSEGDLYLDVNSGSVFVRERDGWVAAGGRPASAAELPKMVTEPRQCPGCSGRNENPTQPGSTPVAPETKSKGGIGL